MATQCLHCGFPPLHFILRAQHCSEFLLAPVELEDRNGPDTSSSDDFDYPKILHNHHNLGVQTPVTSKFLNHYKRVVLTAVHALRTRCLCLGMFCAGVTSLRRGVASFCGPSGEGTKVDG